MQDAAMPSSLIALRGIRRTYGSGPSQVIALEDLDLDIQAGEFVAIIFA